jgi:hypothetical protein
MKPLNVGSGEAGPGDERHVPEEEGGVGTEPKASGGRPSEADAEG